MPGPPPPLTDLAPLLDPELRAAFLTYPEAVDASVDPVATRARLEEAYVRTLPPAPAGVVSRDVVLPGPRDNPGGIPTRIYEPSKRTEPLPAVVYVHGGGFVIGSIEASRLACEAIVDEVGAVVICPGYRLAPEDPFPAAPDDVYAVLHWVATTGGRIGVDVDRIAIAGYSAGGGICAAVGLMVRDRGEISLVLQAPTNACLDDRHSTPSSQSILDRRTWHRERALSQWAAYLGDASPRDLSPYAAPARADSLAGLPPTFISVGALDLLRDENLEFARRLTEAGVATEMHLYPGAFHGFEILVPGARVSRDAVAALHRALRRALLPHGDGTANQIDGTLSDTSAPRDSEPATATGPLPSPHDP
ncbi:MAG: alpha/beta hydrolase [Solirubrobacteraceae bacterium]